MARSKKACLIFFDEIDAIGGARLNIRTDIPAINMLRSPKHSNSEADLNKLDPENFTMRKRKHGDEFTDAFNEFAKEMMGTLNNWKMEFEEKITEANKTVSSVIQRDLAKLTETTMTLKEEIKNVRKEYGEMKSSINKLNAKQKETSDEIVSLQKSAQFNSDQLDGISVKVEGLSQDVKKANLLDAQVKDLKHQNKVLKLEMNNNDQRDRILNLEILGIPEQPNENLATIIWTLLKKVDDNISSDEIERAHRVTPKLKVQGRPRIIVAKLKSRLQKDTIISKVRKLKLTTEDIGFNGQPKVIFINEQLTQFNKQLLKKCKDTAKNKKYQFVWSKNGIIRMRKNETSPSIIIRDEEDLLNLQ
ncbi:unnamed protein product [Plutella xylostella]|uniref:(diamondback moth) hypothetical protein n=2 Tax=Plutella xylostella TaxID=51655 RepID=A0A8S4FPV3_PLUXY|nr:unnamed protein product [Plutella xylostella]